MGSTLTFEGETHLVEIVRRRPRLLLRIDGRLHEIDDISVPGRGPRRIVFDDLPMEFTRAQEGDRIFIRHAGRTYDLRYLDPREAAEADASGHDDIQAPMPGAVVSVHKRPGDAVARGETVITIESMKLQTALASPRDGVIAEILKSEGDVFDKDEVVARLEALAEDA